MDSMSASASAIVPDPQDPETFHRSKLDWAEAATSPEVGVDHARLLQLYRDLAAVRRARPELTDPAFADCDALSGSGADSDDPRARWFVLQRGELSVLVNLTGSSHTFAVAPDAVILLSAGGGEVEPVITAASGPDPSGAASVITLAPDSAAIVAPARP